MSVSVSVTRFVLLLLHTANTRYWRFLRNFDINRMESTIGCRWRRWANDRKSESMHSELFWFKLFQLHNFDFHSLHTMDSMWKFDDVASNNISCIPHPSCVNIWSESLWWIIPYSYRIRMCVCTDLRSRKSQVATNTPRQMYTEDVYNWLNNIRNLWWGQPLYVYRTLHSTNF